MAVACSSLISCHPCTLFRYFLSDFEMVPVARVPLVSLLFAHCTCAVLPLLDHHHHHHHHHHSKNFIRTEATLTNTILCALRSHTLYYSHSETESIKSVAQLHSRHVHLQHTRNYFSESLYYHTLTWEGHCTSVCGATVGQYLALQ